MTQHSDASSDRSEVSLTPPPPVSKMLEFASSQNLSFLNLEHRNMLATPLAALHTMTEMKSQPNLQTHMFPSVPGTGAHNIHTHEPPGIGLPDKTDTESMLERTNIHVERSGMGSQRGTHTRPRPIQDSEVSISLQLPSSITMPPIRFLKLPWILAAPPAAYTGPAFKA
ncbi:hypothetical protein CBL_13852 [Carabus blaptoides fortunei]